MRKKALSFMFSAGLLVNVPLVFAEQSHDASQSLNIAVFGDSPYGIKDSDTAQFAATPAFIKTINDDKEVSLVVHVGDIHSGKQTCSFAYNQSIYDMWMAFESPLVYTPGDNEWMDCNKAKEGGSDPLANLGYVRQIFFANPGHTLAVDKTVFSQANSFDAMYPTDAEYVENVMWQQNGVVFVTVNIPGGSNNGEDNWYGAARSNAQTAEILKRTSASLRWLDKGFAYANAQHARAVVLLVQADMWDLDGTAQQDLHIANYRQYIDNIAMHASKFERPVLLINGDSHGYRSDNPLMKGAPCTTENGAAEVACTDDAYDKQPFGYNVRNFHRIVVHGSTAPMEWVKLTIKSGESRGISKANAFGPFSWQRKIQQLPVAQ